jgi:cyclopropane-fatty-acyl-phospholipid synthase
MIQVPRSSEFAGNERTGRRTVSPPRLLEELIESTGVRFNGNSPRDIQVRDARAYRRILTSGSLGFGEAYMDGLWECQQLDTMLTELLRADINSKIRALPRLRLFFGVAIAFAASRLTNSQSQRRAFMVGEHHYDIGNDVFQAMLDPTLSYSCGYWARARDLDQAQLDKLDMICGKLELRPGERLLDVGCGWGGLARHAAQNYGVEVFGITVSQQQLALARERCAGLPVRLELMDYRELHGTRFDKIASVGMFEHVGPKNYRSFFDILRRLLADDGLLLLHTIGDSATSDLTDPWVNKYIFPNGKLPSAQQIAAAIEPELLIRDWHEFGADYDRTLMAWWDNFNRAWPSLRDRYSQRFYRMWKYYLHACAASFRAGQTQLWQIVLTRRGERPGYRALRPGASHHAGA